MDDGAATWFARTAVPGPGKRPPVVLVHGVVVSGAYFQPVASCLDPGMTVFVPDLPGTGRSRVRGRIWDIEQLAEGLGEWMVLHRITGAVLVSNSVGCQILTMLAARRPELARSLILVAPTVDPAASSVIGLMARGARDLPREQRGLWPVWLTDLARTGPLNGVRGLRDAIRDPQTERLPRIEQHVIVVGGERDPIAPPEWVEAMAGLFPNGRSIILPGAPHAMNYSQPQGLARLIMAEVGLGER